MCLEKVLELDAVGVDQLLWYMQFGMLPHESIMRSIGLLGSHVIPELERRGHRVSATVRGWRPPPVDLIGLLWEEARRLEAAKQAASVAAAGRS